jgi:hypothetical protein
MADGYVLSDSDRKKITAVLLAEMSRLRNTSGRILRPEEVHQAPEVYIAKVPPYGIPALNPAETGFTGTGTLADDVPGFAECDLYRIVPSGTSVWELKRVQKAVTVFNLSSTEVAGGEWIPASRDKYGFWLASASAGGGSGGGEAALGEPIDSGVTPPAPLLEDWHILDYDPPTDTFSHEEYIWARDGNRTS